MALMLRVGANLLKQARKGITCLKNMTYTMDSILTPVGAQEVVGEETGVNDHLAEKKATFIAFEKIISERYYLPGFRYHDVDILHSIDWRSRGAVTPVKDQGPWRTSYAFAAIAALEGAEKIFRNVLVEFSAQELIDHEYAGIGVHGGYAETCFSYIAAREGISFDSDYPYGDYHPWRSLSMLNSGGKIAGFERVEPFNISACLKALSRQPIVCKIRLSLEFMNYNGGLFMHPFVPNMEDELLHSVCVIGYELVGIPYIIIKNSFGVTWGEIGYMRMPVHIAFTYGVFDCVSYPIMDEPSSSEEVLKLV